MYAAYNLSNISNIKYDPDYLTSNEKKIKYHLEFEIDSVDAVYLDLAEVSFNYTEFKEKWVDIEEPDDLNINSTTIDANTTSTSETADK